MPWREFVQPEWQGDSTAAFDPRASRGIALAFEGPQSGQRAGKLWIDDVTLIPSWESSTSANRNSPLEERTPVVQAGREAPRR